MSEGSLSDMDPMEDALETSSSRYGDVDVAVVGGGQLFGRVVVMMLYCCPTVY